MRKQIAIRNLIISQSIIIIFVIFAYFTWFPYSFAKLGGFYQTAFMLIFVDLVLGPLLVYIVFKEGKKHLNFDINTLLAIQISAFIFGAYALFLKHPAYIVFKKDKFILTNNSQLYPTQPWYKQLSSSFFSSPKLVITEPPKSLQKFSELAIQVDVFGKPDIETRPEFFKPFDSNRNNFLSQSISLIQVLTLDKQSKKLIDNFCIKHGGEIDDFAYFPLYGNNKKRYIIAFKIETQEIVGIINNNQPSIL